MCLLGGLIDDAVASSKPGILGFTCCDTPCVAFVRHGRFMCLLGGLIDDAMAGLRPGLGHQCLKALQDYQAK
jgi:hypothetical protein